MRKILNLIFLNFIQIIKEKNFYNLILLFIFLFIFSIFLSELSAGEENLILREMMLFALETSLLITIIFSLTFNFYREKEMRLREIYLTFFPSEKYLFAKLKAYILLIFFYLIISNILFTFFLLLKKAFCFNFLWASVGIFLKISLMTSILLCFCTFFSSPLLAISASFFIYIGSELSFSALKIVELSKNNLIKLIFKIIYHILPNFDKIDFKYLSFSCEKPNFYEIFFGFIYVFIYISFIFLLSIKIFKQKEI